MKITLAKALKVKNRLTGRIATLSHDVAVYNSTLEGQDKPNVSETFAMYTKIQGLLIDLKTAIMAANVLIAREIIEIQELKSRVAWLKALNTKSGTQPGMYGTAPAKYEATFQKATVDGMVGELEGRIDTLQDKIDRYNHESQITVPDELFAPGVLTAAK